MRRRTGGSDAGWHRKLPLSGDGREEIAAPLSNDLPDILREPALSRTRGAELKPVARVRSTRTVRHLVDADDTPLAELSIDTVRAGRSSRSTNGSPSASHTLCGVVGGVDLLGVDEFDGAAELGGGAVQPPLDRGGALVCLAVIGHGGVDGERGDCGGGVVGLEVAGDRLGQRMRGDGAGLVA
ncbi:hypothetical protein ABZV31_32125 [Streptomyces sp. NPDC005202]|uniref:CYTH domain-containing protein n=1 Tax=Streptomyces sp. NPDC005202 TaxID=3157021 RepID=UPI0033B8E918